MKHMFRWMNHVIFSKTTARSVRYENQRPAINPLKYALINNPRPALPANQ